MSLDKPITLSDLSHAKEISLAPFEPYALKAIPESSVVEPAKTSI
ncbi:hypothetical protein SPYSS1447_1753 [Streptococcus pyogenes SS1447]|nr:hypothetical protein SPYSS1447_1753 [Streptococcus pyogenes SS1447]